MPVIPPIPMANMVGGTSIHYGTQSWRFRADDFTIRTDTIAKYGEEALPPGSTTVDWPLTYDELEPYYDQVEYAIGVSGEGGVNPFESPRSRAFPLPPLRKMGYATMMGDAMTELGYHPFAQPAAIISEDYDGRPACTYCGFCGYHACWNDAKSSTLVSTIRKAEETGNLEIRPNSRVLRINSNDSGQVTGVTYLDADGNEIEQEKAGLVILATYVYENVRLLLLSTSDYYPNGLVNSNGAGGHALHVACLCGTQRSLPGQAPESLVGIERAGGRHGRSEWRQLRPYRTRVHPRSGDLCLERQSADRAIPHTAADRAGMGGGLQALDSRQRRFGGGACSRRSNRSRTRRTSWISIRTRRMRWDCQ